MNRYNGEADEFFVTANLNTETELLNNRDSVLLFFDQMKTRVPELSNLHARDQGDLVLEADAEDGPDRWVSIESNRLSTGYLNPETLDDAYDQHEKALELAPSTLEIGPLDSDALDVLFGFDLVYGGNHDEIVAEVMGVGPSFGELLGLRRAEVLNYEPSLTVALDESCQLQCRVSIITRTNAYQVRMREYGDDQISVYLTIRQYWGGRPDMDFLESFLRQRQIGEDLLDRFLIPKVVRPLAQAIASR